MALMNKTETPLVLEFLGRLGLKAGKVNPASGYTGKPNPEVVIEPQGFRGAPGGTLHPFKDKWAKYSKIPEYVSRVSTRSDLQREYGLGIDWGGTNGILRLFDPDTEAKQDAAKDAAAIAATRLGTGIIHTYHRPDIFDDVCAIIRDEASHVIWLVGPTGCGKTVLVDNVCRELKMVKYQINGHHGMSHESFFGERSIEIDPDSIEAGNPQNVIVFKDGVVPRAMMQGLDENGEVIPGAPPGLLFIDEAGALPAHISIDLNRMLESDDPRRTICLEHDGGRIVRSHPGFRVVLAANTNGRGALNPMDMAYTAQSDSLDGSLLNRISATFRMGYDRDVEDSIIAEKLGESKSANSVKALRAAIRNELKKGDRLRTPFSTRHVINICNLHRIYNNLAKAIYLAVYEQLEPEERPRYNELIVTAVGVDVLKSVRRSSNVDYI